MTKAGSGPLARSIILTTLLFAAIAYAAGSKGVRTDGSLGPPARILHGPTYNITQGRVRLGIAVAQERGVDFGRRPGQRIKADRFAPNVLRLVRDGQFYREISHRRGLSKSTVLDIVKRDRAA